MRPPLPLPGFRLGAHSLAQHIHQFFDTGETSDKPTGVGPQATHDCLSHLKPFSTLTPISLRPSELVVAGLAAYLARLTDYTTCVVGNENAATLNALSGAGSPGDSSAQFRFGLAPDTCFLEALQHFETHINAREWTPACHCRNGTSSVHAAPDGLEWVAVEVVRCFSDAALPQSSVSVAVLSDGSACRWLCDATAFSPTILDRLARGFEAFCQALASNPPLPVREQPILTDGELRQILLDWNATGREIPDRCVHQLFAQQARQSPDAIALVFGGVEIRYGELDSRANRLARHLNAKRVAPGVLVGLCVERSDDMVVALLAILKAGGAYVPLDPSYPRERLSFMLEDSSASVLVTKSAIANELGLTAKSMVLLDLDAAAIDAESPDALKDGARSEDLAYTLYTSGSTGKPKGVMVRHRNVVNFFVGIDEVLGPGRGTWLAVTSLSFDISVLELLWTLCRGFKVVLQSDRRGQVAPRPAPAATRPIDFSLMFFASAEGAASDATDRYRLLLEAAKFGDRHGFSAVWTPERHFFAFGGLYPNPSVASAALATITERIHLRAGSVVSPLHNPIRIAEEWALVDNLSHGRVGISFASGWQPVDFVLRPESFADRKAILFRDIETVRRLWRGEAVQAQSPLGKEVEIRTLPRPVQKELPVWVTAAGNPETFLEAGRIGANVLTHLLGQKVEEVGEKIALYRKARAEAGHPGRGTVTLMLHTFVGPIGDEVRETVRRPMKEYLRSSVSLIKEASWTFPTFKQRAAASGRTLAEEIESGGLSDADLDALLDHAFERYYETSGLLGTPDTCRAMIDQLKGIDVDEVACLLDFGVPSEKVLAQLPHLLALKDATSAPAIEPKPGADLPIPAQIRRHGVSHLQCTPSQAKMLVADPDARESLRALRALLLGGEALPAELLAELGEAPGRAIHNMYGPTETTVWSTTARVDGLRELPPIGRPLANTRVYVLDHHLRPVPPGVAGELFIAGEGVSAGYLNRPELTAERFPPEPFGARSLSRMYRTGDRVRQRGDGTLEFLGRMDYQVKIRGHRIEPGEIEAALRLHAGVSEAVVVARDDEGVQRLVAYVVPRGTAPAVDELREFVAGRLPEYMIPSNFVPLAALPLTPNGKIDRKALPAPGPERPELGGTLVEPRSPTEAKLVELWVEALGVDKVGINDSFLHLGGDSLSAIKLIIGVRNAFGVDVSLQRFFEAPTVAALATAIEESEGRVTSHRTPDAIPRRNRALPAPLSPAQERVWFVEQLHPGLRAFHEAEAVRIRGPLDVSLLRTALEAIVARHEALRTMVRVAGHKPYQVVADDSALRLHFVDLENLDPARCQEQVKRLLSEEPRRPFDLASKPPVRFTLVRLASDDHVLILTQHFMICDRWSLNILYRELAQLYGAASRGETAALPEPRIQYADFALWQRGRVEAGDYEGDLVFWKEYLHGAPAFLELPVAKPRPSAFTYEGRLEVFPLGRSITDSVRAFGRTEGFSPFTVVAAALNSLLYRYSGQEDVVVGMPMANRDRPELLPLYGSLIDFHALRTNLSGDPTFRELMGRVQESVLSVHAHRGVPFNKVVEAIKPERDLARAPVFQVMLTWRDRNLREEFKALEGYEVSHLPVHAGGAQYDLTFNFTDAGEEVVLELEYCTDLFDPGAIHRLVDHLRTLLAGALANPSERLSRLPLLPAEERSRVLVEWNATGAEYTRNAGVHELFEEQVRRGPDRVAVVYEGRSWSYRDLNRRSDELAAVLEALGVEPGVLVGLYFDRSPEMVVAALATLKAGGAYLPLDPLYPAARLGLMLEESQPKVLLTQQRLKDSVPSCNARVVCVDEPAPQPRPAGNGRKRRRPDGTWLAYVLYTSGSTGRPKGVQVSHRAVVNLLSSMRRAPGLVADDILLSVTTLAFDIAALELFLPLTTGACVVIASREDASDGARLARLITECGATVMQATPSRWRMLLHAGWQGSGRLKILSGGEALATDLAEQLLPRCAALWNLYGPTETTIWSAACPISSGEPVTIGRPIANTRFYILDRALQPVPVGVPGELFIGGDGVAEGYLNRPELTAERFPVDPFHGDPGPRMYRTGDLVRYLDDGRVEFLGRSDHQAKVRGFRVELGEIENVLARHAGIREQVVVARHDLQGEAYLAAYVVPVAGSSVDPAEIEAFLKRNLPDYMVPTAFVQLDRLPLTPNGKVDRKALPAPERAERLGAPARVEPRTPTEERVAAIWGKLLGRDKIGMDDSFFYLGGHSLLAAQVMLEIQKTFGVDLPLQTLFKQPTVGSLTPAIEREIVISASRQVTESSASGRSWAYVQPVKKGGSKPPLIEVHTHTHVLAPHLAEDQPFYVLNTHTGLDERYPPFHPCTSVEEMAERYLETLREFQPAGPYYLIGYCLGGRIAYEMARRLAEGGDAVGLVAILDAFPFGSRFAGHARQLSQLGWSGRAAYLCSRAVDKVRRYVSPPANVREDRSNAADYRARVRQNQPLTPEILEWRKNQAGLKISKAYVPGRYAGRVTVFYSSEAPADGLQLWADVAAGGVDAHYIPGDHLGMMQEPNVTLLARKLNECLERAQATGQRQNSERGNPPASALRHAVTA